MKPVLYLLLLLLFTACGGPDSATDAAPADAAQTSEPAPGTRPQPVVSGGAIPYKLMLLDDFRDVEGCTFMLWPEGAEEGQYLYGFNYGEGPGEGIFGGSFQTLETVSEDDGSGGSDGPVTFVHANDAYEVTTTVTRESQVDSELWEVSGTVTVRDRESGATIKVRVLGEQGC